jgi:hypothetical protein
LGDIVLGERFAACAKQSARALYPLQLAADLSSRKEHGRFAGSSLQGDWLVIRKLATPVTLNSATLSTNRFATTTGKRCTDGAAQ